MYGLHFRDELPEPTAREFDALISSLKAFLLLEHNEDGSHNFASVLTDETVRQIIDRYQANGQWWKTGPWILDDPTAAQPRKASLVPPKLATGSYNNYAPAGIETAVVLELEPDGGDVTLTGIKALDGAVNVRMLLLRNRDSGSSLFLTHDDSASTAQYRFSLPDDEDVELAPGQNVWLYYDPNRDEGRWTAAITGQANGPLAPGTVTSGGGGGGGGTGTLERVRVTLTAAQLATNADVTVLSGVSGSMIIPIKAAYHMVHTQGSSPFTNNQTISFRYTSLTSSPLAGFSLTLSTGEAAGTIEYSNGMVEGAGFSSNRQATNLGFNEALILQKNGSGSPGNCTVSFTLDVWYVLLTP